MRADRLVATLLLMQTRGRVTAGEVARELEVSVATARRDLEALSAAGVPVYPQPGRGGGWSLVGGARTDLSGLTAPEAMALFLLVGPAATADPTLRSALRKLVHALPETFRAAAGRASDAVVIDPSRWGEPQRTAEPTAAAFTEAVIGRRQVRLTYARASGPVSHRVVDPWAVIEKSGRQYLLAGTPDGRRTFRADRVSGVEILSTASSRPDDLNAAATWAEVVAESERRRGGVQVTVAAGHREIRILRDRFGRQATDARDRPDGRAGLQVQAPTPRSVAEQLAGWGSSVEVIGDDAAAGRVRAALVAIGEELVTRHGS